MNKRALFLSLLMMAGCSPAFACIDCTGTGTNATFTGTLTGTNLVGSTLTVSAIIFSNGDILRSSPSTGASLIITALPLTTTYIQNTTTLQSGTTLYITSGTIQNFITSIGTATNLFTSTISANNILFGDGSRMTTANGTTPSTSAITYNLIITTSGTDTNTFLATADEINIMGCDAVNFSSAASLAKAGAGGLDFQTEQASTSYKLLAIANAACTQFGLMFSSQPITAPVMPTGFTKWRWIGNAYNDSASNIVPIYKRGREVTFFQHKSLVDLADLAPTQSELDFSQFVSSSASAIHLHVVGGNSGSGTSVATIRMDGQTPTGGTSENSSVFGAISAASAIFSDDFYLQITGKRVLMYYDQSSHVGSFELGLIGYTEDIP